jgi:hypothetical protein
MIKFIKKISCTIEYADIYSYACVIAPHMRSYGHILKQRVRGMLSLVVGVVHIGGGRSWLESSRGRSDVHVSCFCRWPSVLYMIRGVVHIACQSEKGEEKRGRGEKSRRGRREEADGASPVLSFLFFSFSLSIFLLFRLGAFPNHADRIKLLLVRNARSASITSLMLFIWKRKMMYKSKVNRRFMIVQSLEKFRPLNYHAALSSLFFAF